MSELSTASERLNSSQPSGSDSCGEPGLGSSARSVFSALHLRAIGSGPLSMMRAGSTCDGNTHRSDGAFTFEDQRHSESEAPWAQQGQLTMQIVSCLGIAEIHFDKEHQFFGRARRSLVEDLRSRLGLDVFAGCIQVSTRNPSSHFFLFNHLN